jgi:hypothetical protein
MLATRLPTSVKQWRNTGCCTLEPVRFAGPFSPSEGKIRRPARSRRRSFLILIPYIQYTTIDGIVKLQDGG